MTDDQCNRLCNAINVTGAFIGGILVLSTTAIIFAIEGLSK